ncbi:MAG: ribonuclease HI family protein [Thaumarchaeota archaeon]|nr:ribonuclease HI family protein [Nitrososphaerota archaeon]
MFLVYTDGLAEPNPGVGTYGYSIYRDGKKILSKYGFAGNPVTNNFAEYTGLLESLRVLREWKEEEIRVFSDSKLLVGQMSGAWKVSKKALRSKTEGSYAEKYLETKKEAEGFARLSFEWIPRELNAEADELSRVAYREQLRKRRGR